MFGYLDDDWRPTRGMKVAMKTLKQAPRKKAFWPKTDIPKPRLFNYCGLSPLLLLSSKATLELHLAQVSPSRARGSVEHFAPLSSSRRWTTSMRRRLRCRSGFPRRTWAKGSPAPSCKKHLTPPQKKAVKTLQNATKTRPNSLNPKP